MEIQELKSYTQAQFEDLRQLMTELSDRVNFTQTDLMMVLRDENCHLYAILDGEHIVIGIVIGNFFAVFGHFLAILATDQVTCAIVVHHHLSAIIER